MLALNLIAPYLDSFWLCLQCHFRLELTDYGVPEIEISRSVMRERRNKKVHLHSDLQSC